MRKPLLWVLAAAMAVAGLGISTAQAEPLKPVAVVSISGYDEIMGDLAFVGKISDRPELATGLEGMISLVTGGRGLEGLDKGRPAGAVIQTDGNKFVGYGLLPVKDLKKLMDVLDPLTRGITETDGVFEVETNQGKTVYVQQKGAWAMVCATRGELEQAPKTPEAPLNELSGKYDVAVRVFVHNIPEKFRQKAIEKMHEGAERDLQQRPGEDDAEFAIRKRLAEQFLDGATTAINELDQISFGWSLDSKAEKMTLDLSGTVLPGSGAASSLAEMGEARSNFAGLLVPGAAMTANVLSQVPSSDVAVLADAIDTLRPKAMAEIERKAKSQAEADIQKELAGNLLDVLQKTLASGRADGGMSLMLGPEAVTLVAGGYVADGPTLEKTLKQVTEIARAEHPDFVNRAVKLDAGKCEGVNLHTASLPIPQHAPDRDKAVALVGETLEIVVGVGQESVYVAAGRDAMKTIRTAIKRSAEGPAKVSPMKVSVAAGPIARFTAVAARQPGEREKAAQAADALENMSGKDHVSIEFQSIERGMQFHLEVEPDVIKLMGLAAQQN